MLAGMGLPAGDRELVQIVDAAFASAAERAGAWLKCRPGCTQCCYGAFPIDALDVERLRAALHAAEPEVAEATRARARAWVETFGPAFPGDARTGVLGTSAEEQARFEAFANEAACPALDPQTGLCAVYAGRPMTCRVFGPPVEVEGGLGCCELCFVGADAATVAACAMEVPHALEARLAAEAGSGAETVVAYALLG